MHCELAFNTCLLPIPACMRPHHTWPHMAAYQLMAHIVISHLMGHQAIGLINYRSALPLICALPILPPPSLYPSPPPGGGSGRSMAFSSGSTHLTWVHGWW